MKVWKKTLAPQNNLEHLRVGCSPKPKEGDLESRNQSTSLALPYYLVHVDNNTETEKD